MRDANSGGFFPQVTPPTSSLSRLHIGSSMDKVRDHGRAHAQLCEPLIRGRHDLELGESFALCNSGRRNYEVWSFEKRGTRTLLNKHNSSVPFNYPSRNAQKV